MSSRTLLLAAALLASQVMPAPTYALEVQQIDLRVADIVFNPQDGMLYASVPGSVPVYGNTIIKIDPQTGLLGPSVFVGSEPGKLALSDDRSRLYVALDGAAAVRIIELPAFVAGLQFPLGSDPFFGPFYAEDIAVQPGNAAVVAISLRYLGLSPRHAGVAVYDEGVARASRTPGHTGSNRIEFASDPSRVYGYNNETTEFGFRRLVVAPAGITELDVTPDLISGFSLDIHYDAGRIYGTNGRVIDPEAKVILGTFPFPSFVFPSTAAPDGDRAYFLVPDAGSIRLYEFNTATFTPVLSQPVAGVVGGVSSLVRWGVDGLAARTLTDFGGEGGSVILMRKIHEPPIADLEVSIDDGADPVILGNAVAYSINARNQGPNSADAVFVRGTLPPGTSLVFANPTQGSCVDSSGTLVCNLFAIAAGDSANINALVSPGSTGTLSFTVTVSSQAQDDDPADNTDTETTEIVEPGAIDADLSARWVNPPPSGTVGRPIEYELAVENAGPSAAPSVSLNLTFSGAGVEVLSAGGDGVDCQEFFGTFLCSLGALPAGGSAVVRATVVAHESDSLRAFASVGSPAPDPNQFNNNAYHAIFPTVSADALLSDLIDTVSGYELKPGAEKTLVRELEEAQAALAEGDTQAACEALADFVTRLERKVGHGITFPQAIELFESAREIASLIGCAPLGISIATFERQRSGAEVTALPAQSRLDVIAQSLGACRLQLALARPGSVRLELIDVRGRHVRTLLDESRPAGVSTVEWNLLDNAGSRVRPGVYFARLVAVDRRSVVSLVVTQ